MPGPLPEVSTPRDLAQHLNLPIKTVYQITAQKDGVPAMRIGRHLRYRRADVEAWLEARSAGHLEARTTRAGGAA